MTSKTISSLKRNGFKVLHIKNKAKAKSLIFKQIPRDAWVFTVPSATLDELGIPQTLASKKYKYVNKKIHSLDKKKSKDKIRSLRSSPDIVLGSAQAITQNGEILTVSTTGSQLPSYSYGAKKVILVVGTNKIVKDLDEGLERIYKYALPLERKRTKKVYGQEAGVNKILIMNKEHEKGRVAVILIEEKLGF